VACTVTGVLARSLFLVLAVLPASDAASAQPAWQSEVDREVQAALAAIGAEQTKSTEPPQPRDKEWVKRRLQHMVDVDQAARKAFDNPKLAGWSTETRQYFYKKMWARIGEIDRAHTAEVKEPLKLHRWFTVSEFGEKADGWLGCWFSTRITM